MSMHGRNDRSVHTEHARISRNLARHHDLMVKFELAGLDRTRASKLAMDVVTGKVSESIALAKAQE